mmetsp:Transcript_11399/g.44295  ORF Transcript_11399/g.44295 Transcript_11399/m.44295 type:complete len:270 (+) Transcript_11399:1856-2665(+)
MPKHLVVQPLARGEIADEPLDEGPAVVRQERRGKRLSRRLIDKTQAIARAAQGVHLGQPRQLLEAPHGGARGEGSAVLAQVRSQRPVHVDRLRDGARSFHLVAVGGHGAHEGRGRAAELFVDQLQRGELVSDHAPQHVVERLHVSQGPHQRVDHVGDGHWVLRRHVFEDVNLPGGDGALEEVGILRADVREHSRDRPVGLHERAHRRVRVHHLRLHLEVPVAPQQSLAQGRQAFELGALGLEVRVVLLGGCVHPGNRGLGHGRRRGLGR